MANIDWNDVRKIDKTLVSEYPNVFGTDAPDVTPPSNSVLPSWIESDIEAIVLKDPKTTLDDVVSLIRTMPGGSMLFDTNIVDLGKIEENIEIRVDFATALDSVEEGSELSAALDYSFSRNDIHNLAVLHRDHESYRTKIEELLKDCNFHHECGCFEKGEYDEFIINKSSEIKEIEQEEEVER